ncbi:MAG: DUF4136 domain-containing protein [Rubrivivax sp.]|nr:DUF4136 domain-containing protein [Rubrivivax sp.]
MTKETRPNRPRSLAAATAACLLALAGCASAPAVRADFDRTADFTQYKSFAFASPLGTDRDGYQTLVSDYLKAATRRELEARGMRLDAAAPQLLVNFNASLNEKLRVTSAPAPVMTIGVGHGYYGYRAGMYGAWPLYADQTRATPYTEGTINVDVVDAARKQLVWEGVITGTVTQKTLDNVQQAIDGAVAKVFEKYPIPGPAPKTP